MDITTEYKDGVIRATVTDGNGNTATYDQDLGIACGYVYDNDCEDRHFQDENLINGVVYAANMAILCAQNLLEIDMREKGKEVRL